MRKSAIVRIVIWGLVLLVLAGLLAAGLNLNAYRSRRNTTQAVTAQPVPLGEQFTFPADKVSALEIDWVAGDITIYPTDTAEITIAEAGAAQDSDAMSFSVHGDCLNIQYSRSRIHFGIGGFSSKDLYIYVPQDWVCRELTIDAADANLNVRDLVIGDIDFDGANGICGFTNCQVGTLDMDTADADVHFSGVLDSLEFDAAAASFTAEFTSTPSALEMDSMSGTMDITLPEDCGYTVTMDGLSSSFLSDFGSGFVHGDGRCRMDVDGMDCSLTIRKPAAS